MSFNFAPKGWAMCNGQLLAINQKPSAVLAAVQRLRRRRPGELRATRPAEWRLGTATGHFGRYPLDKIDLELADEFVDLKLREGAHRGVHRPPQGAHPQSPVVPKP
jgi:Phage Tail Collar Domain